MSPHFLGPVTVCWIGSCAAPTVLAFLAPYRTVTPVCARHAAAYLAALEALAPADDVWEWRTSYLEACGAHQQIPSPWW